MRSNAVSCSTGQWWHVVRSIKVARRTSRWHTLTPLFSSSSARSNTSITARFGLSVNEQVGNNVTSILALTFEGLYGGASHRPCKACTRINMYLVSVGTWDRA
jgi:hypothetical protein